MDSTVLFNDKKARMRFSTSHDYMASESPLTMFNSLDGSYAIIASGESTRINNEDVVSFVREYDGGKILFASTTLD